MDLSIRIRRGKCVVVKTCLGATVGSVKRSIEKLTEMPVAQQVLTFRGKDMNDEETLAHYKLRDRCCVHLSLKKCETSSPPPTVEDRVACEEGPAEVPKGLLSRLYGAFFELDFSALCDQSISPS
uniref:Putative polyubiquitin n=1 Tax=Amblyomma tuberculatum TaxID=48802 RepID=A0A6M2E2Y0_9ACAR